MTAFVKKRSSRAARSPLCFSKKTVVSTRISAEFWSVLTSLGWLFTDKDVTHLAAIAALAWAAYGTALGFYYTKAKHENKIKLTKGMVIEWAEKYGPDFIVQLVGTILSD